MLSKAGHVIEKMRWVLDPAIPDSVEHLKRQPNKIVKHTQTIVWVCLTIFLGWRLEG